MIRQSYDLDANALYITMTERSIVRTAEIDSGTLVDLDADGAVVGIEVITPDRCWPVEDVLTKFRVSPDDAAQLRAYFPAAAQFAPPAHPVSRVPVSVAEHA
jgi:uncharacterized protein YuzE